MAVSSRALGSQDPAPPVNGRKPGWLNKLTKKQAPTTSLTRSTALSLPTVASENVEVPGAPGADDTIEAVSEKEIVVCSCRCCGTLITYPSKAAKIRCSVCHIVFLIRVNDTRAPRQPSLLQNADLSYSTLKRIVYSNCKSAPIPTGAAPPSPLDRFRPLIEYLTVSFSSYDILNSAFKSHHISKTSPLATSGLNFPEIRKFYQLLLRLPSTTPYYQLLCSANSLLSRPEKFSEPEEIYWLLILLELPSLPHCLIPSNKTFTREINSVSYEILKRVIGLLGYSDRRTKKCLVQWFSWLSEEDFTAKVDLVNLYITFILNRCLNSELKRGSSRKEFGHIPAEEDDPEEKESRNGASPTASRFWTLGALNNVTKINTIPNNLKIKISQYGNDWHLRSAGRFFYLLFSANQSYREKKIHVSVFYNTMVDYVNVRQDFDSWQYTSGVTGARKEQSVDADNGNANEPSLESVVDYLHNATTTGIYGIGTLMSPLSKKNKPSFTLCQYPFMLSLGAKISILEYEARRQMERKAEEAFINSLNKKVPIEVYLKLRVRREHLSHDSLRGILQHQNDLKKSLRVEFVNEPGIDAGGLKKEWFLLLIKELFNPSNGLFTYNKESRLGWFSFTSIDNSEMYYLVGVILGLAIYNSTILDLQLPQYFYKKLLGKKKASLEDYTELYPTSGANLNKLLKYDKKFLFQDLELYFEVTYKDIFGVLHTRELIPNGSSIAVTLNNRVEYIHRYLNFFMNDVIAGQFKSFINGFNNVIGGNALSLFDSKEIELLLIGDDTGNGTDKFLDVSILSAVTNYQGGLHPKSEIVNWFWEYTDQLDKKRQKKLLLFISGSDRLPPTGLQLLNFKITLLNGSSNRLPIAHTCFNELCVYNYPQKHIFWNKLTTLLEGSEGFGIK